ncbi:MAG: hypothetical protein Q4F83_01880 [Eubacteriales bacterium]|nr:hypothetical protein [Eubacteriales bacterium]
MLNCGIDFGSTYTTISVYREDNHLLEALSLSQDSPYIPTLVSRDKKQRLEFGRAAKARTGKKGVDIYRAFKMLLTETDLQKLEARGFSEDFTPVAAAEEFLHDLLRQILVRFGETTIHNLVIGAPEIWFKEIKTIAGRSILRDICKEMMEIEHVQVVSEPAAACAFFSYNFRQLTGNPFEGYILLIDYGGGTLDISLAQVEAGGSEDQQSMELKIIESNGAGENVEGRIGKAGIVYMESVIETALRRNGILQEGEDLETDGKFLKAVNSLEEELQSRTKAVNSMFEDCGIDDLEELDTEFTTIEFGDEELEITYALLVEVYNEVIRDVFAEKLGEVIAFMNENGIDYRNRIQDNFKIALVGGFGNYYLVRKQVFDTFQFISQDRRREDIIENQSDCEKAISLGTALLASGIVGIRQTAPYSIGIFQRDMDGNPCFDYAFRYKEEIDYNRAYYPESEADNRCIVTFIASNAISQFIINMGREEKTALIVPLREEFKQKLENVVENRYRTANVGFSLDSSEVVSIHIREYDLLNDQPGETDHVIELTKFSDLFDLTRVEKLVES